MPSFPVATLTPVLTAGTVMTAPAPVVKVDQAQISPAAAAQTMSVDQIRTLPSPLKEQTVAAAMTIGRTDVTAAVQKEVSNPGLPPPPPPGGGGGFPPSGVSASDLQRAQVTAEDARAAAMQVQAANAAQAQAIAALQKQVESNKSGDDLRQIMAAINDLKAQVARHEAAIGTMISDFSTSYQDLKQSLKKKGRG